MIDIALKEITKDFGGDKILNVFNLELKTGERIGLIGRNGCGKSTVLNMIAEKLPYDTGELSIRKNLKISYLKQSPIYQDDFTVKMVIHSAFSELSGMATTIKQLETEMSESNCKNLEKRLEEHGALSTQFEVEGGYEIAEKTDRICQGLKINHLVQDRLFKNLSGGEKTTIELARVLLQNPDVLLLDEPTNNLDAESIEWLETFLKAFPGSVLLISHDRYFLDKTVSKIIEIESGAAEVYFGNFSHYVQDKEKRLLEQFKDFQDQQKQIKAMRAAISRFRDWGNRSNDPRFYKKAMNMEKRIEKMQQTSRPKLESQKINISFENNQRSGKNVIVAKGIAKSFDNQEVLKATDLKINYGSKIAIIGNNGCGKSSLIRILLNQLMPDQGAVQVGSSVKIGLLPQEVSFENEQQSVLEIFRDHFPSFEEKARSILARFLFFNDEVFKKAASLSGGERVRLKLCLLMFQEVNFLVLDEPTNHIDIDSQEVLEEALLGFKGTILSISHDRYFINQIANEVIKLESGQLSHYIGNYDSYKQQRAKLSDEVTVEKTKPNKVKDKENYQLSRQIKKLENKIEKQEIAIQEIEKEILQNTTDFTNLQQLEMKRNQAELILNEYYSEWELQSEKTED